MVTVRVPATTANLGPGFDTLGLALALYNTLTFEELAEGLYFEGVDPEYATAENLAVVAYKAVLSKLGLPMPGLRISVQAEIPICRGLGSSAALIAAGAAGANANHGSPLTRAELLAVCNDIEGHPDNLAPAIFGGLVASFVENERPYIARYSLHKRLRCTASSRIFSFPPTWPEVSCRRRFPTETLFLTSPVRPCCCGPWRRVTRRPFPSLSGISSISPSAAP